MFQSHPNQVLTTIFHSILLNGVDNSFRNMEQLPAITLLCFAKHVNNGRGVRTFISLRQYLAD